MAIAEEISSVTPAALAAVLGDGRVVAATQRLLGAKLRRQAAYALPNEDTAFNGQPRASEMGAAGFAAQEALRDIVDAIDRAAERYLQGAVR